MIKTIFLDLDETILDFHKCEREAICDTMRHAGVEPTEDLIAHYSAVNLAQWKMLEKKIITRAGVRLRRFEIFFREIGVSVNVGEIADHFENSLSTTCHFIDGAEALLPALHEKYRVYIATNGYTKTQSARIKASGVDKYVDGVFISQEIGADKPSKEYFDRCFAHIPDFSLDETIIVGDSLTSDVLGGINVGIKTVWFNHRGNPKSDEIVPDATITSLDELLPLLERI
ncbi:MAG: YjjG family noncanonical pyrimidine nucleotidase [Clostridia bacterium]|nr:YjjG family noncanonical pyrimidine nucleotidase [Clostridia bacterium]